jgi:putative toxin-antitoxin system antitoxin component (TIGR02293 family)
MSQVANTPQASSGFYARLEGMLGIPGIHSDEDLVALVERRLPASAVQALMASGLSDAEVYGLIVPRRTLAHRRAKREPLSREESDKAVRVARITSLAEQTFGESDRAWRWMRKPKRRFQGRTPIEMLASEAGARLIEELLYQVDDGIAA